MSESTWDDPRITAYVLGELPEQELVDFEIELESNAEMAAAVEEARSVTGQLESLYASEPTATLDDQRREAIVLPTDAGVSIADQDAGSWRTPLLVLAIAASLLLLIGVGPWLIQQDVMVSELSKESLELELLPAEQESDQTEFGNLADQEQSASEVVAGKPQAQPQSIAPVANGLSVEGEDKYAFRASGQPAASGEPFNEKPAGPEIADAEIAVGRVANVPLAATESPSLASPDLSLPGLPDVALMAKDADRLSIPPSLPDAGLNPDISGKNVADGVTVDSEAAVIGDVQVEFVPEKGTIVARGGKRDMERVEKVVEQLQELAQSGEAAPAASLSDEKSQSAAATPLSVAPKQRVARGSRRMIENKEADFKRSGLAKNELGRAEAEKKLAAPGTPSPTPVSGSGRALGADARFAVPLAATNRLGGRTSLSREALLPERRVQGQARGVDFGLPIDEGRGPGIAGDRFEPITDNPFKRVSEHPLSTFSVDVDTASYSKTRDFLLRAGHLPRPAAVRIEELLNYFDYDYVPPSAEDKHPFATHTTVTTCPWNKEHRLARIALKGKTMDKGERPACNLVFLLDTSGSMNAPNKLPLVLDGMQMLLKQLSEKDQVAITVYAGSAGLVLDSTSAKKRKKIRKALTQLSASGSTNGGAGIALAYQTARDNFITDGVNRVILCTDGDFNVGTTGTDELVRMVEKEAKGGVFLSVLGFGMGNHNDAMLEKVSGRGNGNYAFIDTDKEARKVLVDQTSGTLVTIAKDVKLQIEFNPSQVSSYRLIGYENRVLAKEDFNDDKKDAGEIGAGHAVTALYEIVPAGVETDASRPRVDDLKYQNELKPTEAADSNEMMTLKLRYKQPDGDTSTLVEFPVTDEGGKFKDADDDVRFAAAVAGFGMQLRRSEYAGKWTLSDVLKVAQQAKGEDEYELRAEFVELVRKAKELMGQE